MSNTKTYTFTEEQLRVVIEDAVDLRDHEVAMNPLLGKPVRTPAIFADEYAKTLGDTFNKDEKEEVKEAEPKVEDEEDEPKGYISSRPVDKLQFNIDTVKLANLPGLFNTLKSEGVFFKSIANRWNAGEVDECGLDRLGDGDGTVSENLADLHYCTDSFWVNPKYANKKVSSLGGIGSRVIAEDGKTSVCLWVYYLEKDGTVIAWDMDVD